MKRKNLLTRSVGFTVLSLFLSGFLGTESLAQARLIQDVPYEIAPISAPFDMPQLTRPTFAARTFNIVDFGAKPKGKNNTKSTEAIYRAIEAAHKAGGGKVLIPKGDWLTGPIHLRSNINLHVEEGATVYFSEDKDDYLPVVIQRYEGVETFNYSPLIYAFEVKNVAITGKGVFQGQAQHWLEPWWTVQPRAEATKVQLSKRRNFGKGTGSEGMRPNFMVFWKSEDILIEDVSVINGPMWNVHLVYSKRVIVRGITINSLESHNGDGIVVDSSSEILLEYNNLMTGDDAIVLKSGFNEEGLEINIPTENVVIRNFYAYDVRTGSGGVVFGSETSGGLRNIYVYNGVFDNCDRGIRFKTARGRGNVTENIYVRDITLTNIRQEALNFNLFYDGAGVGKSPLVKNINIRDIKIDGVPKAIILIGLPEKWLEGIHLENITVTNAKEGIRMERVKDLTMKNVSIESEKQAMIAEDVYEALIEDLKLKDKQNGASLLFKGRFTGSIVMPNFNKKNIEYQDGLTEKIIVDKMPTAAW